MACDWRQFAKRLILSDGRVDEVEANLVKRAVLSDGLVDPDEVAFLLEIKKEAEEVHPEFARFVRTVVKRAVLKHGRIEPSDVVWLRKLLLENNLTDAEDVSYLRSVEREAESICPEFSALLAECESRESDLLV